MAGERRKNPRLGLAIPVRVQGFLASAETWEELTSTSDVSSGGACFPLTHDVELGQVLLLSLALPRRLRQFDLADASYRVYSLIRGVRRHLEPAQVGVMFFGKFPPRGFDEHPSARYLLPTDSIASGPVPAGLHEGQMPEDAASGNGGVAVEVEDPDQDALPRPRPAVPPAPRPGARSPVFLPSQYPGERRAAPRVDVFVNFTIQLVDEWGAVLQEELTVADNVAPGGVRVMTSLGFQVGDVVMLQEAGGGFATRAEVRGVTQVQPTVDRLHLRFIDRQAPDRLLRI